MSLLVHRLYDWKLAGMNPNLFSSCQSVYVRTIHTRREISAWEKKELWAKETDLNISIWSNVWCIDMKSMPRNGILIFMVICVQEVDLSGCQQVTGPLLFWSSAACNLELSKPSRISNPLFPHKPLWPDIPCFENLKTFTLSQCWRIQEEDLCEWLAAACPKLLILRLQDCPQIAISIYISLSACCPFLEVLDLSVTEEIVEMKGAVTVQKSQILVVYPVTHVLYNKSDGLPNLKELSLHGRSELSG